MDFSNAAKESSRLEKHLAQANAAELPVEELNRCMDAIVESLDGYRLAVESCRTYRDVIDAFQVENLGGLIEEWTQIASGNRPSETSALLAASLEAYEVRKTIYQNFKLIAPRLL